MGGRPRTREGARFALEPTNLSTMSGKVPLEGRGSWVASWVRDELFWRDVASRTVSAVVVAGLAAVFAVAAGIIPWDPVWRWLLTMLVYLGVPLIGVLLVGPWRVPLSRRTGRVLAAFIVLAVSLPVSLFLAVLLANVLGINTPGSFWDGVDEFIPHAP
jgi:hypothetical protein